MITTDPFPTDAPSRASLLAGALLIEGGLGVAACVIGAMAGFDSLVEGLAWSGRSAGLGVAATLPMIGTMLVASRTSWAPLADVRRFLEQVVRPAMARATIADLALVSIAAGVGEELMFRGLVQPALQRLTGPIGGLILGSIVFGLVHPFTRAYIALATALGIYLGGLAMMAGDLLAPTIAHSLYDFVALAWLMRRGTTRAAGPQPF